MIGVILGVLWLGFLIGFVVGAAWASRNVRVVSASRLAPFVPRHEHSLS